MSEQFDANGLHARGAGTSSIRAEARKRWNPSLSLRQKLAVRQHSLHRAVARSGHQAFCRQQGHRYDNALAEPINGLYKAELIHRWAP